MYFRTAFDADSLTVNAPYLRCQENFALWFFRTQREELASTLA